MDGWLSITLPGRVAEVTGGVAGVAEGEIVGSGRSVGRGRSVSDLESLEALGRDVDGAGLYELRHALAIMRGE